MDKNTKRMKAERAKQEEAALNRILAWLAGGAVLEFILLLVNRRYSYADTWALMRVVIKVMAVVGLVGCVAGILWYCSARKRGAGTVAPAVCALFSAGLSLGGFAPWFLGYTGLRLAYIAVPVVVVLVLVYYLYQREFFLAAVASGAAAIGLWFKLYGGMIEMVICVLVIIATGALALTLQKTDGKLKMGAKTVQVLAPRDSSRMILISCAVGIVALGLGFVGNVGYYLVFGMAAWIFALLVYYTVKLM